jgi:hypothetical protein
VAPIPLLFVLEIDKSRLNGQKALHSSHMLATLVQDHTFSFSSSHHEGTPYPSKDTLSSSVCLKLHISMRLKIEPNSVRISFLELTNLISLTKGFELTPFIHCSTNHLALCPGPYATWPHPLYKNIASMVEVLYRMTIGLFQR